MAKQSSAMVNQPDICDYVSESNKNKIDYIPDNRYPLCGTFILHSEDHTIGNLLKTELLKDTSIRFAGYRSPHPLDRKIELRVQTEDDTSPVRAVEKALGQIRHDVMRLQEEFDRSLQEYKSDTNQEQKNASASNRGGGAWSYHSHGAEHHSMQ
eukprot:GHVQ01004028.1.p1 GENE.GHVQ01004028.1~~GHVQ01004028.1.p1  ORF type:complete len:154 (-),score=31.26 GHVQ01004028.1:1089-1550(-)